MIARAKTTPIPSSELAPITIEVLKNLREKIHLNGENKYKPSIFYFKNAYHWFKKDVINDLSIIKECINEVENPSESIHNFLKVCFSATILKVSNIAFADNPYFARAKTGESLKKHAPNVLDVFEEQVEDSLIRMKLFYEVYPENVSSKIIEHDSRSMPLENDSIDLVVTSPPYGEESHTMSYSRFTKLSLIWLGFTSRDTGKHTSKSLGGTLNVFRGVSPTLDSLYEEIAKENKQRAMEVFSFFWDYKKCIDEMYRVLRRGCLACIVIGDRSALGIRVPNGELTTELAKISGFNHEVTYHREIPKKVLPRSDYKVELINKEDIVLLKKQ